MSKFSVFGRRRPADTRDATSADLKHLQEFVESRGGVEAYLEPRTAVTGTTMVLVAATGEWTRRRVTDPKRAAAFAKKHDLPLYDAARVGYPRRMREWTAQQKTDRA